MVSTTSFSQKPAAIGRQCSCQANFSLFLLISETVKPTKISQMKTVDLYIFAVGLERGRWFLATYQGFWKSQVGNPVPTSRPLSSAFFPHCGWLEDTQPFGVLRLRDSNTSSKGRNTWTPLEEWVHGLWWRNSYVLVGPSMQQRCHIGRQMAAILPWRKFMKNSMLTSLEDFAGSPRFPA